MPFDFYNYCISVHQQEKEHEVFGLLILVITLIVKGKQRKRKLINIDNNFNSKFTRDYWNIQNISSRVTL